MKSKKISKLDCFVFGVLGLLFLGRATGSLPANKEDDNSKQKTKVVKQDLNAWRDTLYVLSARPSVLSNGYDVVFTNRYGTKQKICGMRDDVTTVQDSDIVVIDADCRVVELLDRKCKLDSFVKQR